MTPSVKAILAKFGGDRTKAIDYCETMAYTYAHLRSEYRQYRDIIGGSNGDNRTN